MIASSAKFCLESKRNADAQVVEFRISEQVILSRIVLDGTSCSRLRQ